MGTASTLDSLSFNPPRDYVKGTESWRNVHVDVAGGYAQDRETFSTTEFIRRFSPELEIFPHVQKIADLFQSADEREQDILNWQEEAKRLREETGDPNATPDRPKPDPFLAIILSPPQHGKTETELHDIARYVHANPGRTCGFVSYNTPFAHSKARKAIRYMERAGVRPDPRRANLSEWRTIQGGGLLSAGMKTGLTGQKIDRLYIDDPIKNRQEAESKKTRDTIWATWEDVLETRLHEHSSVFVTLTRWHEDDLAGRLMKEYGITQEGGDWYVLRMPALADGLGPRGQKQRPDPIGREEGRALCPALRTEQSLQEIKENKAHTFTALYQGLPRSREEKLFRDATFFKMDQLPAGVHKAAGADLAYTKKTKSNHSAYVVIAKRGRKKYIVDAARWKDELPVSKRKLKALQNRHHVPVALEANGPQAGVCSSVEDFGVRVRRTYPTTDKYVRALDFSEDWNAGNVLVPEDADWVSDYLEELQNFTGTGGEQDDWVDASVMADDQFDTPQDESPPPQSYSE